MQCWCLSSKVGCCHESHRRSDDLELREELNSKDISFLSNIMTKSVGFSSLDGKPELSLIYASLHRGPLYRLQADQSYASVWCELTPTSLLSYADKLANAQPLDRLSLQQVSRVHM